MPQITTEQQTEAWKSEPQTTSAATTSITHANREQVPLPPKTKLSLLHFLNFERLVSGMFAASIFLGVAKRFPVLFDRSGILSALILTAILLTTIALYNALSAVVMRFREHRLQKKNPPSTLTPTEQTKEKRGFSRVKGIEALLNCLLTLGGIFWTLRAIPPLFGNTGPTFATKLESRELMALQLAWVIVTILSSLSAATLAPIMEQSGRWEQKTKRP